MFNKAIHSTILTSEVANRLFSNITVADLGTSAPDQSFLATLRALLRKRLPQNETMHLVCKELRVRMGDLLAATASQCMSYFVPDSILRSNESEQKHCIAIVHATQADVGVKMLEIVRANAGSGKRFLSNYSKRDDLQVFYARKVSALFYTDEAGQNTIIFVDKMELRHFHVLQMMIPKYLPRLFVGGSVQSDSGPGPAVGFSNTNPLLNTDNPLTETETALLKSTGNKSAVEYEKLIEQFAKDFDIRAEIIRSKLAGFETVFERMRADELRGEISSYQQDYEHHLSILRDITNKMQERRYVLAGLECAIAESLGRQLGQLGQPNQPNQPKDSELMEYFMCNKNLTIVKVAGTAIEFVANGYADIYDEDAFEQYVGNLNGYMYSNLHPSVTKPQMEMLYRAIFSEGIYKLRICAAYRADMRAGLRGLQNYALPPECQTYLPNPHIQSYGCIGTYAGRFQECIQRQDYVGAIDQAVVSARNLNFYDSMVMAAFAKDLSRTTIRCIEKSDGTLLTPREAIVELEG